MERLAPSALSALVQVAPVKAEPVVGEHYVDVEASTHEVAPAVDQRALRREALDTRAINLGARAHALQECARFVERSADAPEARADDGYTVAFKRGIGEAAGRAEALDVDTRHQQWRDLGSVIQGAKL